MTTLVTVTIGPENHSEGQALYAFVMGVVSVICLGIGVIAMILGVSMVMIVNSVFAFLALPVLPYGLSGRRADLMAQYQHRREQAQST